MNVCIFAIVYPPAENKNNGMHQSRIEAENLAASETLAKELASTLRSSFGILDVPVRAAEASDQFPDRSGCPRYEQTLIVYTTINKSPVRLGVTFEISDERMNESAYYVFEQWHGHQHGVHVTASESTADASPADLPIAKPQFETVTVDDELLKVLYCRLAAERSKLDDDQSSAY